MYLVYILKCDNLTYVGMTNDFFHRWKQHNGILSGGARYTKRKTDWLPICIIDGFKSMSEAMQCEWRVKKNKKIKGSINRIKYLNELLKKERWTSNSPLLKDQDLKIYIKDEYKELIDIETRELYY
jgi:predicted GIY-YIG superfamily endonuclease